MSSRIQTLHPAWFASIMSTAGIGLISLLNPLSTSSVDEQIGMALTAIATVLIFILIPLAIARFYKFKQETKSDFFNPAMGPLFAASSGGALVTSIAIGQVIKRDLVAGQPSLAIAAFLLAAGLIATLFIGITFFYNFIQSSDWQLGALTGSWFIPVVVLVLVPSGLARLIDFSTPQLTMDWAVLAIAAWGAGFILFLLLAAIIGYRLLTLPAPAAHAAATWWIWLAPMGAGGLGAIAIGTILDKSLSVSGFSMFAEIIATAFWGFGIWWMLFSATLLWKQRKEMHFHLGTWGFGFPSAAFGSLTIELGLRWDSEILSVSGTTMWVLSVFLWIYLAFRTIQGIRSGSVFKRA